MISWPYIAGFFDGEGNIAIKRHSRDWGYGFPVCRISQSGDRGLELLMLIKEFLATQNIKGRVSKRLIQENYRQPYSLDLDGWLGVNRFLSFILPYLHIKRTEAQDILRYRRLYPRPPQRDALLKGWVTRRAKKVLC